MMTNLKEKLIWVLSILTTVMVLNTACKEDDDPIPVDDDQDIVELAQSNPDLSTLVSAIVAADLTTALKADGPFTVFAPTNAAFSKLDADVLNNILGNPAALTALLQYHVVSGNVLSTDLSTGEVNTLLADQTIDVNISGSGVILNGTTNVTQPDVEASNGVIHLIDEVLIPDDFAAETIVDIASGNPDFSILVQILSLPEMSDLLVAASNPASDLTVFAPTNDAFEDLLTALGKSSLDEIPTGILKEIVQYHIVAGTVLSTDLSNGSLNTLLEGETLDVNVDGSVTINDNPVAIADVKAINGVVHGIGAVLLPEFVINSLGTISEVVLFNNDYTILAAALRKAELLNTVSTTDNLTVFAPNNAAFEAAGITSLDGLSKEDLTPVLLYHVVGAKVLSTDLPADGKVETLNSESPYIYLGYLTNNVVLINGLTQITGVDIEKSNGVIHTINRTLVPPAPNVVEIAATLADAGDDSEFTVLVSLLTSDSLSAVADALIAAENVTVFAPTDAAFEEISDIVPTLTAEQLADILQYHAVGARVFSTDLSDGQEATMLNGQTITINISGGAVSITDQSGGDDANISEVNIQGSNGVIHVIDKVILPTL